jgi:hypothetical protein
MKVGELREALARVVDADQQVFVGYPGDSTMALRVSETVANLGFLKERATLIECAELPRSEGDDCPECERLHSVIEDAKNALEDA